MLPTTILRARVLFLMTAMLTIGCRTLGVASEPKAGPECKEGDFAPAEGAAAWLLTKTQKQLERVFDCAVDDEESPALPTGFGRGVGSLYAGLGLSQLLQEALGGTLWGGKRFYQEGDGIVLVNDIKDTHTERYFAHVNLRPSIRGGVPTVVLDYRDDRSRERFGPPQSPAQSLIDAIAPGIRDEIRAVAPGVYVGRAYLYHKILAPTALITRDFGFPISDPDFDNPENWKFAANFFLDFNEE